MKDKGLLMVISGFSGAGKGTVVSRLLEKYGESYSLSISATTRKPRIGEVHGREYFFKTLEEFDAMISNNELIEYAKYVENYYGTPKEYVDQRLEEGYNVILEIEIQGALKVKKIFPEVVLIFLFPPDVDELQNRLKNRGTETDEVITERMHRACKEIESAYDYDYIVVNDNVDSCTDVIHNIVNIEKLKSYRKKEFIEKMQKDLNCLYC